MMHIPNEAIVFTTGYDIDSHEGQKVAPEEYPEFRNVTIEDVTCTHCTIPLSITGLKEKPIHDINLKNIRIAARSTDKIYKNTENIKEKNVQVFPMHDENY